MRREAAREREADECWSEVDAVVDIEVSFGQRRTGDDAERWREEGLKPVVDTRSLNR